MFWDIVLILSLALLVWSVTTWLERKYVEDPKLAFRSITSGGKSKRKPPPVEEFKLGDRVVSTVYGFERRGPGTIVAVIWQHGPAFYIYKVCHNKPLNLGGYDHCWHYRAKDLKLWKDAER